MDEVGAKQLEAELIGLQLNQWEIVELIDNGKSAAVFKAKDGLGNNAAIKIFDRELIQKFGEEKQLERISRETDLVGKTHNNVIKIYGGGRWDEQNLLYVIMEYVPFKNLRQVRGKICSNHVKQIVKQLADACIFLEAHKLAHRDIKLENIVITDDFSQIILLDLGVIHPFGLGDDYDGDKHFVATLRCSPPELLLRQEEDTVEGWRAISFYQIGAVIYELLMDKDIFAHATQPYAALVNAVQYEDPRFERLETFPPELVLLAIKCLYKRPADRLEAIRWEDFCNLTGNCDTRQAIISALGVAFRDKDGIFSECNTAISFESAIKNIIDTIKDLCSEDTDCFPPNVVNYFISSPTEGYINIEFDRIHTSLRFDAILLSPKPVNLTLRVGNSLFFAGTVHEDNIKLPITEELKKHILKNLVGD